MTYNSIKCTYNILKIVSIYLPMKGKTCKKYAYIPKMMRQKAIKAGIENIITFHSLRHTALTRLYEKTKDIRLVQEIAGHSDIKMGRENLKYFYT